jgi:hypothetical protein
MPQATFRGDPYETLEVAADATSAQIKRRWRELAREHHPDRAAGDVDEAGRLTRRMARINAAYDLLRDPERRARYDAQHPGAGPAAPGGGAGVRFDANGRRTGGPPPPPRTRPVTGRFDTSEVFHPRNAATSTTAPPLRGHAPLRRRGDTAEPPRASDPNGPVERRPGPVKPMPSLEESRGAMIEFGRFRGFTLGEVERHEPTYIDWIARTITRDRDLVVRARVIQADMDERGVERRYRPSSPGWGVRADDPRRTGDVRAPGTQPGPRDDPEPRHAER